MNTTVVLLCLITLVVAAAWSDKIANNKKQQIPSTVTIPTSEAPTPDNPFGNSLPLSTTESEVVVKTDKKPSETKMNTIRDLFYENVLRPIDDYFDTKTSYRQFYTLPSRAQDMTDFINYLYSDMTSCKSDRLACSPYYESRSDVRSLLRRTYPPVEAQN